MNIISVHHICKQFGETGAVKDLSFEATEGEILGIIGPDGAGKTTLFRILTSLILADSGSATVAGFDVKTGYRELRKHIGYMPGKFSLYQDLSVEENLRFFATIFNTTIETNYHLIADIYRQIEPFKKRRAGKLSGGMKQKLALCCALIHKPKVLFLDEPTTGVDPVSRKEFWGMLKKLKSQGLTILVSTPYMDEATLCDRIGLIQEGAFLQLDSPASIIRSYPETLLAVSSNQMHQLLKDLREHPLIKTSFSFGEVYHVTIEKELTAEQLKNYLTKRNHSGIEIRPLQPTVEDCFMLLSNTRKHG